MTTGYLADERWTPRSEEWDTVGFIISSGYRTHVLRRLAAGPATPAQIAHHAGVDITHVSRALNGLREHDLVTLHVPESRRKGRIYGILERGSRVLEFMQSHGLVD